MVRSTPPGGDFNANPHTRMLRPATSLSDSEVSEARRMRRQGKSIEVIARFFAVSVEDMKVVLASLRTPVAYHRRRTANIGVQAYRKLCTEQRPGEPMWQTVDRLLSELDLLRTKHTKQSNPGLNLMAPNSPSESLHSH